MMRAVSNVVAAIVLIGITIAGFALAYPILFSEAKGVSGIGSLMGLKAHAKAVKLVLADYSVAYENRHYVVKLWIYNAGWEKTRIAKLGVPGYSLAVSVVLEPGSVKEITLYVPERYGSPDRVVVVTDLNVFLYSLS